MTTVWPALSSVVATVRPDAPPMPLKSIRPTFRTFCRTAAAMPPGSPGASAEKLLAGAKCAVYLPFRDAVENTWGMAAAGVGLNATATENAAAVRELLRCPAVIMNPSFLRIDRGNCRSRGRQIKSGNLDRDEHRGS